MDTILATNFGHAIPARALPIELLLGISGRCDKAESALFASVISPYRSVRDELRELHQGRFVEVYVSTPVEVCSERDVKGLYIKALRGDIANFTGISDPYEEPLSPDVVVRTERETIEESTAKIIAALEARGYIDPVPARAPEPALAGAST